MAIINARMRQKRGHIAQLDKDKLLPGEFAIPEDNDKIYICIKAGVVLEIPSTQSIQGVLDTLNAVVTQGTQMIDDFRQLEIDKVGIDDNNVSTMTTYSSDKITQLIDNIFLDKIYPVGSIYLSVNDISPENIFGGKWEMFSKGRTLVGIDESQDEFNEVEKAGGEKEHVLNTSEVPVHAHGLNNHMHSMTHSHTTPNVTASGTTDTTSNHVHAQYVTANIGGSVNGRCDYASDGTNIASYPQNINTGGAGSHNHSVSVTVPAVSTNSQSSLYTGQATGNTNDAGSGLAHNNLQPYVVCYMWKRVE